MPMWTKIKKTFEFNNYFTVGFDEYVQPLAIRLSNTAHVELEAWLVTRFHNFFPQAILLQLKIMRSIWVELSQPYPCCQASSQVHKSSLTCTIVNFTDIPRPSFNTTNTASISWKPEAIIMNWLAFINRI